MSAIRIDFIADLCCPWCYVAWRALDRAILARPDLQIERTWGAFLLRPDTPKEGVDRAAYIARIFEGQPERARLSREALQSAAEDAEAPLNLEAAKVMPNTIDAHRLVAWAGGQGKLLDAINALFAAYFVDGRNIGEREVLLAAAGAIGLDRNIVADLYARDADWNLVADGHNNAVEAGVRGVPVTVFNGRFARQGAESVATYAQLIVAAAS